jgi:hypothetical protein
MKAARDERTRVGSLLEVVGVDDLGLEQRQGEPCPLRYLGMNPVAGGDACQPG